MSANRYILALLMAAFSTAPVFAKNLSVTGTLVDSVHPKTLANTKVFVSVYTGFGTRSRLLGMTSVVAKPGPSYNSASFSANLAIDDSALNPNEQPTIQVAAAGPFFFCTALKYLVADETKFDNLTADPSRLKNLNIAIILNGVPTPGQLTIQSPEISLNNQFVLMPMQLQLTTNWYSFPESHPNMLHARVSTSDGSIYEAYGMVYYNLTADGSVDVNTPMKTNLDFHQIFSQPKLPIEPMPIIREVPPDIRGDRNPHYRQMLGR